MLLGEKLEAGAAGTKRKRAAGRSWLLHSQRVAAKASFSRPVLLTLKKEKSIFQRIMWGTAREKRLEFIRSILFKM